MQKIIIIGISGTGKTKLAIELSNLLKIPIVHYDELVWAEKWQEINEKIVEQKINNIVKNDKWIIEGFIHPAAKIRLENAELVIYLDYSGLQAVIGGLQRWWQYRGKNRPEMASGCIEELNWNYLKVMWKRNERTEIEEAIEGFENKIIRLKTRKEVDNFIAKISKK